MLHNRIAALDELRGLAIIMMTLYHFGWNLHYMFHIPTPWFADWRGVFLQVGSSTTFLILGGICTRFGHAPYRRFLIIAGSAALVSAATLLFAYEDRIIFGILHLTAACHLLYAVGRSLWKKIPPALGASVCGFLFLLTYHLPERYLGFGSLSIRLPDAWYQSVPLSILGFLSRDFYSADYFPLIPFVFAFFFGHFIGAYLDRIPRALHKVHIPFLGWMGRHSLIIYLLHQPIMTGIMILVLT